MRQRSTIDNQPVLDPEQVHYVGLYKVQELVAGGGAIPVREKTSLGMLTAELAYQPAVGGRLSRQVTERLADLTSAAEMRRQLPQAIKVAGRNAKQSGTSKLEVGNWFQFNDDCSFGVMGQDSFSYNDGQGWCAFWRIRVTTEDGRGRYIIMTGTAEGNLSERWNGQFPGNRAGSGTSSFHTLLRDLAYDMGDENDHEMPYPANWLESADWIAGPGPHGDLSLFRAAGLAKVLKIRQVDAGQTRVNPLDPRSPWVTEIVFATPLYSQFCSRPTMGEPDYSITVLKDGQSFRVQPEDLRFHYSTRSELATEALPMASWIRRAFRRNRP